MQVYYLCEAVIVRYFSMQTMRERKSNELYHIVSIFCRRTKKTAAKQRNTRITKMRMIRKTVREYIIRQHFKTHDNISMHQSPKICHLRDEFSCKPSYNGARLQCFRRHMNTVKYPAFTRFSGSLFQIRITVCWKLYRKLFSKHVLRAR